MAAADILKNMNLFVDGRGYAGQIEEYTPPVLSIKTEDFRAGGMDTSIALDMGMEKLEASFALASSAADIMVLFGVAEGNQVQFTARGALESFDGKVTPVVHTMRGKIRQIDQGNWKSGEKPQHKYTLDLTYFKAQQGSTVIHEIDVENMVRIVNGVDRLSQIRTAIGV